MSVRRRDFLGTVGAGSASAMLWALGCGAPTQAVRRAPQVSDQVRLWLRDAVSRLAAVHPAVHALAVSRQRTTVAQDVLGAGIAALRSDAVVFTVRTVDGVRREHVVSSLTAASIDAAVTALGATRARASVDFGRAPAPPASATPPDERDLRRRVERLLHADRALAPRIVYAAALIDHDDALVWSVAAGAPITPPPSAAAAAPLTSSAPRSSIAAGSSAAAGASSTPIASSTSKASASVQTGRDLEQRLVRIRQSVTRAAWNGPRPVVRSLERAWSGTLDDHTLTDAEIVATSEAVLEQMTPGTFDDGPRTVVLDPSVVALLFDIVARHILTGRLTGALASSASAPPAAKRAPPVGALLTLIDDPTVAGAYGGYAFDDAGQPAVPTTLIDAGRVTDVAARIRRAEHLGLASPSSTHLVLSPGSVATSELYADGFILEAGLDAFLDPATDHLRLSCGRARELRSGSPTGRVYPDVELVGALTTVLTAIDAIARDPMTFALSAAPSSRLAICATDAAPPRWASIAAPALRTHGFIRSRRPRA